MKTLFYLPLLSLLLIKTTYSFEFYNDMILKNSTITYHMHYMLKNIQGITTETKGRGRCEKEQCNFILGTPVKSFLSKDSGRDSNMLKYTRSALYPVVSLSFAVAQKVQNKFKISVAISFAGKHKTYDNIDVTITKNSDFEFVAKGEIPLLLSDFEIDRPSLLLVSVDDLTPVSFETTWTN